MDLIQEAVGFVGKLFGAARPKCAFVLGSGWASALSKLTVRASVNYCDIPGMGSSRVAGHPGELVLAAYGNTELLVFRGRHHWYEGLGWLPVILPVFITHGFKAKNIVLTNAVGGIRADLKPQDIMVIDDHINAMGSNPLIAIRHESFLSQFPDQGNLYDKELRRRAHEAAARVGLRLQSGVYLATAGPAYETPAETRAFRAMGADAVGMSIAPEAMAANALGMKILGLSSITNMAPGLSGQKLTHDEVQAVAGQTGPALDALLGEFIKDLCGKTLVPAQAARYGDRVIS